VSKWEKGAARLVMVKVRKRCGDVEKRARRAKRETVEKFQMPQWVGLVLFVEREKKGECW
jgi:hypothetical protein